MAGRRPSLRRKRTGPQATDVENLAAIQRWENKKAVMYKTVDTFAGLLNRKLWLKNGPEGATDGHEIIAPLDDPDAMRVVEHELAHAMYRTNLAARKLFLDEYTAKILTVAAAQQVTLDGARLREMLKFLTGVLDDRRVDSLWGVLFEGSEKLKRERDARLLTAKVPDPHKSVLLATAFVLYGVPLPPGAMDRYRPYLVEARRKVERRGYPAVLAVTKWLVTMLVTEIVREARALPPPPESACSACGEEPDPQGEQACPVPQEGAVAAPNGAGAPEGGGEGSQPWEPPQDAQATPQERSLALQSLVEQTGEEGWKPPEDVVPSKYPKPQEEWGAKLAVAGVMRLDVNDQKQMEAGLEAGKKDMQALIAKARATMRQQIEGDAWLRKGALARVVFKDVLPKDVEEAPLPLSREDEDTVKRLRALFNRVMGRVRSAMDDTGVEIDVPAYIQQRLTGEGVPCFRHELRGQGFKTLLLVDRSGSMAGWKAQQVERSARIVKRALHYPFVDDTMWGFQSLGYGQIDISRMAEGVETFNTKKSAVGGVTPLNVAVRVAARHLEGGPDVKHLYIITDGFPVFQRREDESYGTLSLMLWTRDEIHKARQRGIGVTGVIIGHDLSDHMVSLIFGPRRYWKRITVEETGEVDADGEPVVTADRLGSELVSLISSGFVEYLKRG